MKKLRGVLGVAGSVFGAVSAVKSLQTAKQDKDKLLLINAVAGILTAVTGVLLTIRSVREDDK
jgi:hypothetical protein